MFVDYILYVFLNKEYRFEFLYNMGCLFFDVFKS